MDRKEEFDLSRLPQVLYHGADFGSRSGIESRGLRGGHVTDDPNLAAEYGGDIYEVRKHPNIVRADTPQDPKDVGLYGIPGGWHPSEGVFWAQGVPATHVKRVGHVINHYLKDYVKAHGGGLTKVIEELHWHKKEDCPLSYDNTYEDINEANLYTDKTSYHKNVRPHPTDPNLTVSDS